MPEPYRILVILGPTASGKTHLAVSLASQFNGEIISADSRQVYRGMDIGTGKDLQEYQTLKGQVPVHLIDCCDPTTDYDLYHFQTDARRLIADVTSRGHLPVVCGGTGLYLSALLQNYQLVPLGQPDSAWDLIPDENLVSELSKRRSLHNSTDTTDRKRLMKALSIASSTLAPESFPPLNPLVIGIKWPRQELYERIGQRLKSRLEQGMIEETKRLLASGVPAERLRFFGLEYKWLTNFLEGQISFTEMETGLYQAIRKFAKRQETWFRKMEKEGVPIRWIEGRELSFGKTSQLVYNWLKDLSSDFS